MELHAGRDPLVERTEGVHECGENPCSGLPCHNSGTCLAIDSERYRCVCNPGYTGDVCEIQVAPCASSPCAVGSTCLELPMVVGSVVMSAGVGVSAAAAFSCQCAPGRKGKTCQEGETYQTYTYTPTTLISYHSTNHAMCVLAYLLAVDMTLTEVFIPEFRGDADSYLALPRLENVARAFSLEVWFLSRSPTGLLLYDGQLVGGRGDFISLNLVNGYVQFRFDLGSGTANIT